MISGSTATGAPAVSVAARVTTSSTSVGPNRATAGYATSSPPPATLPFSRDLVPNRPALSPDQLRYCSEALEFFKAKFKNPETIKSIINSEFDDFLEKNHSRVDVVLKSPDVNKKCSVAFNPLNYETNNRYTNVLPFDFNRVILDPKIGYRPAEAGYINASFIKMNHASTSQFIATQGPKECTFQDFWAMILQYRCKVIIMLTKLKDDKGGDLCSEYFPVDEWSKEFGSIIVKTKWKTSNETGLTWRYFEVNYKESKEPPLDVLHIQYLDWPDKEVPENNLPVLEILKIMYHVPTDIGPVVVHCSAGIGRAGTYCTIHNTIQRILLGDKSALKVLDTVTFYRCQRMGMVQNKVYNSTLLNLILWYTYSVSK
ncbi:OLC1v1015793C3 [Oldenlandia corymbosa var. corymbosa]|uniref:OLC1v1015793C3 n=1 Tax=Oldenlandia corymbosa var. corymbosa TaxID=529605 RepID=A0AAV1E650_OLDCO|nr:OLC1v1015793C3 [Oldenlandia corymbosa var. corymbosa]